jgi:IclR family pca regulon transcriptional regulator
MATPESESFVRSFARGLQIIEAMGRPYWGAAQGTLEELCGSVRQSCALSVLDGEDIVYVLRQHTKRILPMSPSLGSRLPAHAVSMGRVHLASLDDDRLETYLSRATIRKLTAKTVIDAAKLRAQIDKVREQGWAWVAGELDESIAGLAVPVRDAEGATVASINVSLVNGTVTQAEAIEAFLPPLRIAASRLRAAAR